MAYTFPLTMPNTPAPRVSNPSLEDVVALSVSPYTKEQQAQVYAGQLLYFDVALPPITDRKIAAPWRAFLAAMKGRSGTCYFGPTRDTAPIGNWAGTPLVNGGTQTGSSLILDGFTPGATVKAGDWFDLGSGTTRRLYMNLFDGTADGSGNLTIDIFPILRESPVDNAPINTQNPKGVFRLAQNKRGWGEDPIVYGVDFQLMEAI